MTKELELIIRKSALKDVELWLNQQYIEIEKELQELQNKPTNTVEGEK